MKRVENREAFDAWLREVRRGTLPALQEQKVSSTKGEYHLLK